jgi:hypothetical protein
VILTPEHVLAFAYWRLSPGMRARMGKRIPPSIDHLVNAHAGIKFSNELHNTLHLVRMRMRNGDSASKALIADRWCMNNTPKRAAMLIRWRSRLHASLERRNP